MQLKPLEWKDPPEKDKEAFGTIAICRVLGLEYQILTMNDDLNKCLVVRTQPQWDFANISNKLGSVRLTVDDCKQLVAQDVLNKIQEITDV